MAWLTGWTYRKKLTLTGSTAGAQTDYSMRVDVHRATNTDSGHDVYVDTKCNADFSDIRFTQSDGDTELDYWHQETIGTEAIFWVEVASIAGSPTTTDIYVYYGNAGASTTSDGDNTFQLFDDFPGSSLDTTTKWSIGTGTPAVSGGTLTLNDDEIYSQSTFTDLAFYYYAQADAESCVSFMRADAANPDFAHAYGFHGFYDDNGWAHCIAKDDSDEADSASVLTENTYYYWRCFVEGSSSVALEFYRDTALDTNDTSITHTDSSSVKTSGHLGMRAWSSNRESDWDWIFGRKYCDPEPTYTSWGSEETETPAVSVVPKSLRRRKPKWRPRITKRNIR